MTRRNIHCAVLLSLAIIGVGVVGSAQDDGTIAEQLQRIQAASDNLVAFSATIEMTRHHARNESTIVFDFCFEPSERMRIRYTAPASLDGQTMILNGDRFYTYIPSLNRHVWQDVGEESNNQGEEMGFLFEFVNQNTAAFFSAFAARMGEPSNSIGIGASTAETLVFEFESESEQQCVWIDAEDLVPVAVSIYAHGELTMEVRVLDYEVNGELSADLFAIPEE
ncbi:hypothetical protein JW848_07430 [Candidatus Bipolaricaulota bacterium]|nr:hypothetical protein [Candidatus Bipolaricaulota bacterium]